MEQRFFKGDLVRVRPFDEIDRDEIGRVGKNECVCFAISSRIIDRRSGEGPFVITSAVTGFGTYIYHLRPEDSPCDITYWWAQGMLRPDEDPRGLPEPDTEGLFSILFSG